MFLNETVDETVLLRKMYISKFLFQLWLVKLHLDILRHNCLQTLIMVYTKHSVIKNFMTKTDLTFLSTKICANMDHLIKTLNEKYSAFVGLCSLDMVGFCFLAVLLNKNISYENFHSQIIITEIYNLNCNTNNIKIYDYCLLEHAFIFSFQIKNCGLLFITYPCLNIILINKKVFKLKLIKNYMNLLSCLTYIVCNLCYG